MKGDLRSASTKLTADHLPRILASRAGIDPDVQVLAAALSEVSWNVPRIGSSTVRCGIEKPMGAQTISNGAA
ncbi:hypothetical protein PLICRDRAFT_54007 [Plicaturopsis crispa FD-325 SS-3]|nr:hypothetical protein PLICRDRAFT_54007 [Plicaturopsis crispa FD-325 SS-3]